MWTKSVPPPQKNQQQVTPQGEEEEVLVIDEKQKNRRNTKLNPKTNPKQKAKPNPKPRPKPKPKSTTEELLPVIPLKAKLAGESEIRAALLPVFEEIAQLKGSIAELCRQAQVPPAPVKKHETNTKKKGER